MSAPTSGIRQNWIQSICQCVAANGGSLELTESLVTDADNRRTSDRYHTHSGAYTVPDSNRGGANSNKPTRSEDNVSASQASRAATAPSSDSKYSSRRRAVVDPGPRTRRRRQTADNVISRPGSNGVSDTQAVRGAQKDPPITRSRSDQDGSKPRDLSQYFEEGEKPRELDLTEEQEEELDNIEQNIRQIHRRSITEFVQQQRSPKHLEKFESGRAYADLQRPPSLERLPPSPRADTSSPDTARSSRTTSPSRKRSDSDPRSPLQHRAPSAKVLDKARSRSPRPRSPPPETADPDEDFLDTFVQRNLESELSGEKRKPDRKEAEKKWKDVSF